MDNPEKLAALGTQDEENHNTICVGHQYTQKQTQITKLRHETSYTQLGVKMKRTSFYRSKRTSQLFVINSTYT